MESMATPKARKKPSRAAETARGMAKSALLEAAGQPPVATESFYRDLVWNLRNGVLAVTQDGRIAVMNEVAYRIFGLTPSTTDIGRPYVEVLRDLPDVIRVVSGA